MGLRQLGAKAVDVLVNGQQVDSFTQDAPAADYDVSVSDDTQTVVLTRAGQVTLGTELYGEILDLMGGSGNTTVTLGAGQYAISNNQTEWRLTATDVDNTGSVQVRGHPDANGTSLSPTVETPWRTLDAIYNYSNRVYLRSFSGSQRTVDYRVQMRTDVSSGFTVNGATQS